MNASERTPYSPTWYTATMVPASARPPLTYDLDVDVCVIGAGLAGLTTAREIARRGWSVAVLESHRIASSASGRNAYCNVNPRVAFGRPLPPQAGCEMSTSAEGSVKGK